MRQIVLSDFTGEMMARRARERKRVYDAQVARYRQQADENALRIRQDYEAALEAYKRRAAKWEEGGIGTKLALGLLRPVTILNILTLCLLAGVAAKFAAPHFLGGSGRPLGPDRRWLRDPAVHGSRRPAPSKGPVAEQA